jgi:hypothetical protein
MVVAGDHVGVEPESGHQREAPASSAPQDGRHGPASGRGARDAARLGLEPEMAGEEVLRPGREYRNGDRGRVVDQSADGPVSSNGDDRPAPRVVGGANDERPPFLGRPGDSGRDT